MELSKDIDLNSWKKNTGATCYAAITKNEKTCMYTASGEAVCIDNSYGMDGASIILGRPTGSSYCQGTDKPRPAK